MFETAIPDNEAWKMSLYDIARTELLWNLQQNWYIKHVRSLISWRRWDGCFEVHAIISLFECLSQDDHNNMGLILHINYFKYCFRLALFLFHEHFVLDSQGWEVEGSYPVFHNRISSFVYRPCIDMVSTILILNSPSLPSQKWIDA